MAVEVDDSFDEEQSTETFTLVSEGGERFVLDLGELGEAQPLTAGERIAVDGELAPGENRIVVRDIEVSDTQLIASTSASGTQTLLVMMVNFTNLTHSRYSSGAIQNLVFGAYPSVNTLYQEQSWNKFSFSGTTVGAFNIDASSTTCDRGDWASKADAKYPAANTYQHVMYVLPIGTKCSWIGHGDQPGRRTWVILSDDSPFNQAVMAHELGHNLGLAHANGLDCGAEITSASTWCTGIAYYDAYNVMGGLGSVNPRRMIHFSSLQKSALGWITASEIATVSSWDQVVRKTVYSRSSSPGSLKLVRVATPQASYWIDFRNPTGMDNLLPADAFKGLAISSWGGTAGSQTMLLDAHPESTSGEGTDFGDAAFWDGEKKKINVPGTISAPATWFWVRQVSRTSDSVTFELSKQ